MSLPKRVAAIDVSHWHSAYDASYLRILRDLGCDIVGVSDRAERIAKNRAERFGGTPFTDYRRMIETTRPEFVVALGRHCDMPETFRFLVAAGIPFIMEKPWGTDPDTVAALARLAADKNRLARRYLEDERISLQQIAWLLGYSEIGAFNHAFKRWTGISPGRARTLKALPASAS